MGMFDIVDFSGPCPNCLNHVSNFQSKSGPFHGGVIKLAECKDFYGNCGQCGCWIYFVVENGKPVLEFASIKEEVFAKFEKDKLDAEYREAREAEEKRLAELRKE